MNKHYINTSILANNYQEVVKLYLFNLFYTKIKSLVINSPNQSLETANVMGFFIEKSKVRTISFEISIDLETLPTVYL